MKLIDYIACALVWGFGIIAWAVNGFGDLCKWCWKRQDIVLTIFCTIASSSLVIGFATARYIPLGVRWGWGIGCGIACLLSILNLIDEIREGK